MPLADWRAIYRGARAALDPACRPAVAASAAAVEAIVAKGEPVYGINTGFGKLASVRIDAADLAPLQRNIVLSHAAGVGEPMPVAIVRLMMALKLASLAQGASGVRPETIALLEAMLARDVIPVVPAPGLGRRLRRSRAARAYDGGDDRRRRGFSREARDAGGGGARARRSRAARARPEGRAGAAQRHAVLDRVGAGRPVRGRARVPGGAGDRRAVDRRGAAAPTRRSIRASIAARPSRPDRDGGGAARADGRQRDPRLASRRRRARAGPLLPALPAAGDGRRARRAAPGRGDAGDRGQRRLRQSADLRRRPARRCRAAISTPSRWPSRPT